MIFRKKQICFLNPCVLLLELDARASVFNKFVYAWCEVVCCGDFQDGLQMLISEMTPVSSHCFIFINEKSFSHKNVLPNMHKVLAKRKWQTGYPSQ